MEEAEHLKFESHPTNAEDDDETPFDKFMKSIPKQEIDIDLSKFDGIPMSTEELAGLDKIQEILKLAEKEINRITANATSRKDKRSQPNVMNLSRNDEKQYIRNLVYAKLHGLKIEHNSQQNYHHQKYKHCRNKNKYSSRSRVSEEIGNEKKSHFVEELSKELDEIIKKKVNSELSNSNYKSNMWLKNNHLSEIIAEDKCKSDNNVLVRKNLVIQNVPKINIRPCLTEQKIPSLNIYPSEEQKIDSYKVDNVILLESKHEEEPKVQFCNSEKLDDKMKNEQPETSPSPPKPETFNSKTKKNPNNLLKQTESVDFLCDFKHYDSDNAATVLLQKKYSFLKNHSEYSKSFAPQQKNKAMGNSSFTNKPKSNISQHLPKTSNVSFNKSTKVKSSHVDYIPYSKMTIGGMRANEIINELNVEKQMTKTTSIKINKPENLPIEKKEMPQDLITSLSSLSIEEHKEETKTTDYTEDFEKSLSESSKESSELSIKTVNSNLVISTDDDISQNSNMKTPDQNISQISLPHLIASENKIEPGNGLSTPKISLNIKPKPLLKMKSKVDTFDYIHHIDTEDHAIQTVDNTATLVKHTQTSPNSEKHEGSQEILPNFTLDDIIQMKKEIQSILSFKENLNKEISHVERHPENKLIQTSPIKMHTIDKQLSPIFVKRHINVETMTDTVFNIEDNNIVLNSNPAKQKEYENILEEVHEPMYSKVNDFKNVSFVDSARNISSGMLTDMSYSETSETKSIGEINFKLLRKRNITVKTRSKNKSNKVHFNSSTNSELHSTTSKSEGEIFDTI